MKRTKQENRPTDSEKATKPKWWIIKILAPIIVGLVLFVPDWIKEKVSEEKYGELLIESNLDNAKIVLNKELRGSTLADRAVKIASLKPGIYVLSVEKDGFEALIDQSVRIAAGEITSIRANLKTVGTEEGDVSANKDTLKFFTPSRQPAEARRDYSITITVSDRFKNAKIMIDSDWIANAPNTIAVSAGRHHLRIESDEFYYEEMIQIPSRNLINVLDDEFKSTKK